MARNHLLRKMLTGDSAAGHGVWGSHVYKGITEMAAGDVQRRAVCANWTRFTDSVEEQRLIVLDARIERRKRILADDVAERSRIMKRAIRRMRRAEGKE